MLSDLVLYFLTKFPIASYKLISNSSSLSLLNETVVKVEKGLG